MLRFLFTTAIASVSFLSASAQPGSAEVLVESFEPALASTPFSYTGLVSAPDGSPVAGAELRWWEQERPEALQAPQATPAALSDTDGSFSLHLPSAHVRYTIQATHPDYLPLETIILGPAESPRLTLSPRPRGTVRGHVSHEDKPIANATVTLLRGETHRSVTTGANGRFEFAGVPKDYDSYGLYASSGKLISPLVWVYPDQHEAALSMGAPGALNGVAVSQEGEMPVANAAIDVIAEGSKTLVQSVTTDEQGRFLATSLAPATYLLRFRHEAYAVPGEQRDGRSIPTVAIRAGEDSTYRLVVSRLAEVSGSVVGTDGQPVEGAWVALKDDHLARSSMNAVQLAAATPVRTDAEGRFAIRTPYAARTMPIEIYHPAYGRAEESIHIPEPGGTQDNIRLSLSGAIRVRGVVSDEAGEPIPGIAIGQLTTDGHGVFDSGIVPLPKTESSTLPLEFLAPRPNADSSGPATTRFLLHRTMEIEPHPGESFTLNVQLQTTRAVQLSGTVFDSSGKAPAGAEVSLEIGKTKHSSWFLKRRDVDSLLVKEREENLSRDSARPRYSTTVAADGTWALLIPMESEHSLKTAFDGRGTAFSAQLEVKLQDGTPAETRQFENLALLPDATQLAIALAPPAHDPKKTLTLAVVDPEGRPLEGIVWSAITHDDPIVTDAAGLVRIERGPVMRLQLESADWFINSPKVDGHQRINLKYMAPPYRVTLGRAGAFEFKSQYPDGEVPYIIARYLDNSLRDQTDFTPEGFVISNLPSGTVRLSLSTHEGFMRDVEIQVPPEGKGQMTLEVPQPSCSLAGRVRTVDDEVQPDLSIELWGIDYFDFATTDENGQFELNAPPGTYALLIRRNGIPCLTDGLGRSVTLASGGDTQTLDLAVRTPPATGIASNADMPGTLRIQLLGADSTPLAGVALSLKFQNSNDIALTSVTDRTGYVTFPHVKPGTYATTIQLDGPRGEQRRYEIPVEEGSDETRVITLAGTNVAGYIHGMMDASPVEVSLYSVANGTLITTHPAPDGRFQLTGVPEGFCRLRYRYRGMGLDRSEPMVVDRSLRPLRIELPGGRIEGQLPGMAASLMHSGDIRVRSLAPGGGYLYAKDDGATFAVDLLQDGDYQVEFVMDHTVVAQSEVLTIKNGIAIGNVTLEFDPNRLPDTPSTAIIRPWLERQSSTSK